MFNERSFHYSLEYWIFEREGWKMYRIGNVVRFTVGRQSILNEKHIDAIVCLVHYFQHPNVKVLSEPWCRYNYCQEISWRIYYIDLIKLRKMCNYEPMSKHLFWTGNANSLNVQIWSNPNHCIISRKLFSDS